MASRRSREDALQTYRSKRGGFRASPEPSGDGGWRESDNPIFVVHEHAASSLHYDLRLEVDGVLASWAVPKGPSTDQRDRRLAIHVEDHPLDYADFEGVIPKGQYGGGAVIVWDAGPLRNDSEDEDGQRVALADAIARGRADVWLEGKKIRGGYLLIHARPGGDPDAWLLIKKDDAGTDARRNPTSTQPRSVLSGRTVEEVAEQEAG